MNLKDSSTKAAVHQPAVKSGDSRFPQHVNTTLHNNSRNSPQHTIQPKRAKTPVWCLSFVIKDACVQRRGEILSLWVQQQLLIEKMQHVSHVSSTTDIDL